MLRSTELHTFGMTNNIYCDLLYCPDFNLAEAKIFSHASSWTERLIKEAWLSNENSINKCIELPQAYSVLRVAIS